MKAKTMDQVLSINRLEWKQVGINYIEVTFAGYADENYIHVEKELCKIGLAAVKRSYSKKQNRTTTLYKRRNNVY